MNVSLTIGWTKSDLPEYSSFCDGYRPGAAQHVETITVDLPDDWDAHRIAEAVFVATNHPFASHAVDNVTARVALAISATGFYGQGGHYSLSVGDTVTVNGVMLACADLGFTVVEGVEA